MNVASHPLLEATLVHRSGSGIRFRTSQVRNERIPSTSRSVTLILPNGTRLSSRLTINIAIPWITGDSLIRWIKERLAPDTTVPVTVEVIVHGEEYQLLLPDIMRSTQQIENIAKITTVDENWRLLARLLDGAESQPPRRRTFIYECIERDARISPLVRTCFGNECQVQDCIFTSRTDRTLDLFIAEVHHLEHLSRGGTHAAYNLCVLCASHHRFFHRDISAHITGASGDNVSVSSREGALTILRDLSRINAV